MLISFNVSNHLGVSSMMEDCLFVADTKNRSPIRNSELQKDGCSILTSVFLLGDNGSGKTSYLNALYSMAKFVTGDDFGPISRARTVADKESSYEIVIKDNENILIEYSFTVGGDKITVTRENLTVSNNGAETVIFDRVHTDNPIKESLAEAYPAEHYRKLTADDYKYYIRVYDYYGITPFEVLENGNEALIPLRNDLFLTNCWAYSEDWPDVYGIKQVCKFFENGIVFWQDVKDDSNFFSNILSFEEIYRDAKSMAFRSGYNGNLSPFLRRLKKCRSKVSWADSLKKEDYLIRSIDEIIKLYSLIAFARQKEVILVIDDFGDNLSGSFVRDIIDNFMSLTCRSQLLAATHKEGIILSNGEISNDSIYIMKEGNCIRLNEYKNISKENRLSLYNQGRFF